MTPEAVLVELPTAGAAARSFARVFDLVFNFVIISTASSVLIALVGVSGLSVISGTVIGALAMFAYLLVFPIASEVLWRGRTVGKLIFGLKVVGVDGSRLTNRQAMVRGFVAVPEIFLSLGVLAMASMVLSERNQRLGDLAAGTVVIRSQTSSSATVPIAFHPPVGYEGYVQTLAVGQLRDDDFVLIRDFLLRVKEFSEQARNSLALSLAESIQRRIQAPLPGNIAPELWLICVASAYQLQSGGLLADAAMGLAPLAPPMPLGRPAKGKRRRR